MRTETLSGAVQGSYRKEMIASAKKIAAMFYGTECVSVVLVEARVESAVWGFDQDQPVIELPATFSGDFIAAEHHDVSPTERGFAKCRGCGRTNYPTSPLPQAEWEPVL